MREYIVHLPRGHRWAWGGKRWLACGGAASVDVMHRLPGRSWWPQEVITAADVEACVAGGATDVLVSHDAPLMVVMDMAGITDADLPLQVRQAAYGSRLHLQQVVDSTLPSLILHGHWHHPHDTISEVANGEACRVVGLNADVDGYVGLLRRHGHGPGELLVVD